MMIGINSWKNLKVKHFKTFRKVDLFEFFFFQPNVSEKYYLFFKDLMSFEKHFTKFSIT